MRTALVLVIDGDLLLQAKLREKLQHGSNTWDSLLREANAGSYHVLPSFDTRETSTAYRIAAGMLRKRWYLSIVWFEMDWKEMDLEVLI